MFSFNNKPEAAVHQQAEETEQQLIERVKRAKSQCDWTVGEAASTWCEKFARGRTESAFADLVGVSRQSVNFKRRVYERFREFATRVATLSFYHFREALAWHDAEEWLEQAEADGWSVREMVEAHDQHYDTDPVTEEQDEDECQDLPTSYSSVSEPESGELPSAQTRTGVQTGATQPTSGGTTASASRSSSMSETPTHADQRDNCNWSTWIREADSFSLAIERTVRGIDDNKHLLGWKHGHMINCYRDIAQAVRKWKDELEEMSK